MSTSKSCHFCGKNIVKEFDALTDNVNRSKEEVTKETDEKITTKRWSSHYIVDIGFRSFVLSLYISTEKTQHSAKSYQKLVLCKNSKLVFFPNNSVNN